MAVNVKSEVSKDGKSLVITVDLTQQNGESSTGKTFRIASTEGTVRTTAKGPNGGVVMFQVGVNESKPKA